MKQIGLYLDFVRVYGCFVAKYVLLVIQLLINLLSAFKNDYQGGCKFPYISEAGREGINRQLFILSTVLAVSPWVVFSLSTARVHVSYSKLLFPAQEGTKQVIYCNMQLFVGYLNCVSAVSYVLSSYYDILAYPELHEQHVTRVCFYGNVGYIIDSILFFINNRRMWNIVKYEKIPILLLSCLNVVLFPTLNMIPGCGVQMLPMEECFQWTSESRCFSLQDSSHPDLTMLRYYPKCPLVHFWRGLSEYLALLFGLSYLCTQHRDVKMMKQELLEYLHSNKEEGLQNPTLSHSGLLSSESSTQHASGDKPSLVHSQSLSSELVKSTVDSSSVACLSRAASDSEVLQSVMLKDDGSSEFAQLKERKRNHSGKLLYHEKSKSSNKRLRNKGKSIFHVYFDVDYNPNRYFSYFA